VRKFRYLPGPWTRSRKWSRRRQQLPETFRKVIARCGRNAAEPALLAGGCPARPAWELCFMSTEPYPWPAPDAEARNGNRPRRSQRMGGRAAGRSRGARADPQFRYRRGGNRVPGPAWPGASSAAYSARSTLRRSTERIATIQQYRRVSAGLISCADDRSGRPCSWGSAFRRFYLRLTSFYDYVGSPELRL
jgi:hypothetical protein